MTNVRFGMLALVWAYTISCRPSDVLSVPAPSGVTPTSGLESQQGAESVLNGAKGQVFTYLAGPTQLIEWSEMLTDEFTFAGFDAFQASYANIDARATIAAHGFIEYGDLPWAGLLRGRSSLLVAVPLLERNEPPSSRFKIGEAYALVGHVERLLAESYCAGTPLDQVLPNGGVQYGMPLTTDALLAVAQAHFDTAVMRANGDPVTMGLASVGLGATLLDRGQYAAAATAVNKVPTSFVYNIELNPMAIPGASPEVGTFYSAGSAFLFGRIFTVPDREGGNGLDFASAHDPRLLFDTTQRTVDGSSAFRLPLKFEANLALVPLATGIEARLLEAEAALQTGQTATWLADLNRLRNSGCTVSGTDTTCSLGTGQLPSQAVGLPSLTDPGTDSGRVSLLFRERAFWLFGTGKRLGDLRRLIRQYGRIANTVFPSGPYANGHNPFLPAPLPTYGADVSLTLPTTGGFSTLTGNSISNPNYRGCLSSTATP